MSITSVSSTERSRWPRAIALAAAVAALAAGSRATAQPTPPAGLFQTQTISPALDQPVAMAFAPDGRLFVAEQAGVVKVIHNNAVVSTFIDLRNEVNGHWDRGMLGLAIDPNFAVNRRVYVLYAVDPVFGEPDEDSAIATFSRLVRYEGTAASNGGVADMATRSILIGVQPSEGIPVCWRSHTGGALRFGPDGMLLSAHGDGAVYDGVDSGGQTPGCFQPGMFPSAQDIGAFRAQMINSMSGKILRVDPETGDGLPGNPFWQGSPTASRSRVWLSGLRNPFRFCVRPGTGSAMHPGTIYVGDVGWDTFEEVTVAPNGGANLGWPCREGFSVSADYPEVLLTQWDCSSIGSQANPGPLVAPIAVYHHFNGMLSTPIGLTGFCVVGGLFHVGNNYPSPYRGAYFFADNRSNWVKVMRVNDANQLQAIYSFSGNASGPVDFAIDPLSGEVCVLSYNNGRVYRFHSLIGAGDVNRNGTVDVDDLIGVILAWGPCSNPLTCPADLNASGQVDVDDLIEVILNWG